MHLREISVFLYSVQVKIQYLHIVESYKREFSSIMMRLRHAPVLFCSAGFGCNLTYSEAGPEVFFEHLQSDLIRKYFHSIQSQNGETLQKTPNANFSRAWILYH